MLIPADAERRYIHDIFRAIGTSEDEAEAMAEVLVEADLRGHTSHGLQRVPLAIELLQSGHTRGNARPHIRAERAAAALLDADRALGPYAGIVGAREAITRARRTGAAAVAVANCSHMALVGYYAELVAREDMIGILFGKAEGWVHPHGGMEKLLGTNPLAIAIPTNGDPLLLDMATSATSAGKVHEAAAAGRSLAEGEAIDPTGAPTTDPAAALEGALSPVGGAKGYGLGLAIELLAAVLTGVAPGPMRDAEGWRTYWGALILVLDPAAFTDVATFKAAVSAYLQQIKESRKAPGFEEILIPGERSYRRRREQLARGVQVADGMWRNVADLAREVGVDAERYLAAPA